MRSMTWRATSASPYNGEGIPHSWMDPMPLDIDILSAPPASKLAYICRRLREPGAASQVRSLRVHLWWGLAYIEILLATKFNAF